MTERYRGWGSVEELKHKRPLSESELFSSKRQRTDNPPTPNCFTPVNKPGTTSHDSRTVFSSSSVAPTPAEDVARRARNPIVVRALGLDNYVSDSSDVAETLVDKLSIASTEESPASSKLSKTMTRKPKGKPTRPISDHMRVTKPTSASLEPNTNERRGDGSSEEVMPLHQPAKPVVFELSAGTVDKLNAFRYNPVTSLDAFKTQQSMGYSIDRTSTQRFTSTSMLRPKSSPGDAILGIDSSTSQDNTNCEDIPGSSTVSVPLNHQFHALEPILEGPEEDFFADDIDIPGVLTDGYEQQLKGDEIFDMESDLADDDFLALAEHESASTILKEPETVQVPCSVPTRANQDDAQLPTPLPSDIVTCTANQHVSSEHGRHEVDEWECIGTDEDDAALLELADGLSEADSLPLVREEFHDSSDDSILELPRPSTTANEVTSSTTSHPVQPESMDTPHRRPISRPPLPDPIRDRSSIIGVSGTMLLRTCFRIGDAIKTGTRAVRLGQPVVLEIYARVKHSWREPNTVRQHFVFYDLFHDHQPFLNGLYELWKGVELWDYDAGRFLGEEGKGRMARVIGKMKREGTTKWTLTVLNIFEATWEDVEYVEGIVCA